MRSLWCKQGPDPGPGPVGLMADSHGDSAAIAAGMAGLKAQGCTLIVHLGDICDSADARTAEACVAQLSGSGILAVCGNNDRALVIEAPATLAPKTRQWLAALPLTIQTPSAVFTHNRPDVGRLGVSALFGDLDDAEALSFLRTFPGRLLFRGHSHRPLLRRLSPAGLETLVPPTAPGIVVAGGATITCGSLERNTALIWEPQAARVHRICF